MAHCLETLLESKDYEDNEETEVYRNNLYGDSRPDAIAEEVPDEYDFDNELEEDSKYLSYLLDLAVGTPEMVRYRQGYCEVHDHFKNNTNTGIKGHFTGSKAEGLDLAGSDEDYMIENPYFYVRQGSKDEASSPFSLAMVFVMETDATRPCFTLLRFVGDPIFTIFGCFQNIDNKLYLSSYLDIFNFKNIVEIVGNTKQTVNIKTCTIQGPSLETCHEHQSEGSDYVYCLKCDFWPLEANEWLHRHRPSGWPADHIIQRIRGEGCHLVAVGHPWSERKEMEWRMSFSIPERYLIWSFNHVQMQCYAFLKILLKEYIRPRMAESILCSYFIKTILLWEIESHPSQFWTNRNLQSCLNHLIRRLDKHIVLGHLSHYFIPKFNLFEIKVKGAAQRKLIYIMRSLLKLDIVGMMIECQSLYQVAKLYGSPHNERRQLMRNLDRKFHIISLKCILSVTERALVNIDVFWKSGYSSCALNRSNILFDFVVEYEIIGFTKHILSRGLHHSHNKNKSNYIVYRTLLRRSIRTDIVSKQLYAMTWLFVVRNLSKCLRLAYSLPSSIPPYYTYFSDNDIRNEDIQIDMYIDFVKNKNNLPRKYRRFWMFDLMVFPNDYSIFPAAIQVECIYSDSKEIVYISPFVYMYYLQFLCFHGLHDYPNRDLSLSLLKSTADNEKQGGGPSTRYHSYNIAGHCLWFVGRFSEARDMFIKSVQITERTDVKEFNSAWHYIDMIS